MSDKSLLYQTARVFYMVKGHIPNWLAQEPEDDLRKLYHSYINRLWHNEEAYIYEEGFEEEWGEFYAKFVL